MRHRLLLGSLLGTLPGSLWTGPACAPPPARPVVSQRADGLKLTRSGGIDEVVLVDPEGLVVLTRRLPAAVPELHLDWDFEEAGAWTARVSGGGNTWQVPVDVALPEPVTVSIEAPVGQDASPLVNGEDRVLALVDGQPAEVCATITAHRNGKVHASVGAVSRDTTLRTGERMVLRNTISRDTQIRIETPGQRVSAWLRVQPVSAMELGAKLTIARVDMPTDARGQPDLGRPAGRVTLPAAWWHATLQALGLGLRAQDPWAPWAYLGVVLRNDNDGAVNVVVRLRVVDAEGRPAPAFEPHLREGGEAGAVSVLLRVPANDQARAALPLFVDEPGLSSDVAASSTWTRVIEVLPLGSPVLIATDQAPLWVSRGSTAASLGLVAALVAALLGTALLLGRGRRWLAYAPTSELMTIALFGSLSFVVSAIGRLLTMGVAAILGPFAILLTGLVDDCLRYTLLATLITLLPRVGTASLAVLVGWLLSGFAMGTFSPTDLLFVAGQVFWLESLLWISGLTRGRAWLDEPPTRRFLRLTLGLGGASLLSSATGLVLNVTLYRLFLADWYVLMVLALPGFLYVALACALAVPFADSLRRVQR